MTRAAPGDRIIVRCGRIGGHDRDGEVLEARGPGGGPPFLVRWSDDGHVSLFFPGPDTVVHDGLSRNGPSLAAIARARLVVERPSPASRRASEPDGSGTAR